VAVLDIMIVLSKTSDRVDSLDYIYVATRFKQPDFSHGIRFRSCDLHYVSVEAQILAEY
jgi:hypothetical protein